jgi:two-component system response regulator HydG
LRERVKAGLFREDLLYRLEVVTIELPPLRLRHEDLPALIEHFLARAKEKHPSAVERIGRDALAILLEYAWPGNVRELEHAIERLVLLGRSAEATSADLPPSVREKPAGGTAFAEPVIAMREMQRRYAAWAFERLGGRKMFTAETLGIDDKTLTKLLARGDE